MYLLFLLIPIIILIEILYLGYLNFATNITLNLSPSHSVNMSVAYVILAVALNSTLAVLFLILGNYNKVQNSLKEYKRKLEKTSVNAECDNSRVAVLESKIQVLEKALENALNKDND